MCPRNFSCTIQVSLGLKADDDEVLIFNPKLTLKANHYQGKYIELWLKVHGKDEIVVEKLLNL